MSPFTMRAPRRVINPLRFSLRKEERTSVEPGSVGASSAAHSSRPALREVRLSWSAESSHSSSRADVSSTSLVRSASLAGGHTRVDMSSGGVAVHTCMAPFK